MIELVGIVGNPEQAGRSGPTPTNVWTGFPIYCVVFTLDGNVVMEFRVVTSISPEFKIMTVRGEKRVPVNVDVITANSAESVNAQSMHVEIVCVEVEEKKTVLEGSIGQNQVVPGAISRVS